MRSEEAFIRVDDAPLWTATSGRGQAAVVLNHGGPGLSDNLEPIAEMLNESCVVHRYDQRGGGRSSTDGPYTVSRFVNDLETLRRTWKHDTWVVGGHSWGGWLSLLYALSFPDHVSGVVVIDMPPFSDSWRAGYRARREERVPPEDRAFFEDVQRRERAGLGVSPQDHERWTHLLWRTDFVDPDKTPDFTSEPLYAFPANLDVNRALVADMDTRASKGRLVEQLRSLTMPVLVVHGQEDRRPPPRDVAAVLPNCEMAIIPGAAHFPWLERPEPVADALRSWIRGLVTGE